jgi:DNA-binding MarR family transcriptional regulator
MSKIKANRRNAAPSDPDRLHRQLSTAVVAFHEAVAHQSGLGISEHKCLGALLDLKMVTASRLARETGFTTGAITGIVDRLERAGHVKRERNPDDRRSVLIRLLHPKKRRKFALPLFAPLSEAMAELRQRYSKHELAAIYDYLARTTDILKEQARRLEDS